MGAHVLLNLSNELGKRDKMRDLSSILSLFCNEFNKFRGRMFDSIYHMKFHFCREYFLFFYWDIKNQIKQTKQTTFSRQKIIVGIRDI